MLRSTIFCLTMMVTTFGLEFVLFPDSGTIDALSEQTVYLAATKEGPRLLSAGVFKGGETVARFDYSNKDVNMVWVETKELKEAVTDLRFSKCFSQWPSTSTHTLLPAASEAGWYWPVYNAPWIHYVGESDEATAEFDEDGSLIALTDLEPGSPITVWRPYSEIVVASNFKNDVNQKALQLALLNNKVYIDTSTIHGLGMFTAEPVTSGDIVAHFDYNDMIMTWAPHTELTSRLEPNISTLSNWQWSTNGTHSFLPSKPMQWFSPSKVTLFVHYLNHDHDGNLRYDMSNQNYYATRDLKAGEELTVDYRVYCMPCYNKEIRPHLNLPDDEL
eukprot:TRINITY_DN9656_c0_g1_i7.p2 TRINITY_DN9656_c0_g1~~TRINITY_DN9656_c0_g1_i7.p2  ORF type:complete len:355 (+),score=70.35 TRINITY_DN9656_c0_g1_i7:74-1066(+)